MKLISKVFSEIDTNKNGILEREELAAAVKETELGLTDGDINNMLIDLDMNKDGVVQEQEFAQWWLAGR